MKYLNKFFACVAIATFLFSFSVSAQGEWAHGSLLWNDVVAAGNECPAVMIGNVTTGEGIASSSASEMCWGNQTIFANPGDIINVMFKMKNLGPSPITMANARLSNNGSATPVSMHLFTGYLNGNATDSESATVGLFMNSPQTVTYIGHQYTYYDVSAGQPDLSKGFAGNDFFNAPQKIVGTIDSADYGYMIVAFEIGSSSQPTSSLPIDDLDVEDYEVETTLPSSPMHIGGITAWEGCFDVEDDIASVQLSAVADGDVADFIQRTDINVSIYRNGNNIPLPNATSYNGQIAVTSAFNFLDGDQVCIKVYTHLDGCVDEDDVDDLDGENLEYEVGMIGLYDGNLLTENLGSSIEIEVQLPDYDASIEVNDAAVDSSNSAILHVDFEIEKDDFDVTSGWIEARIYNSSGEVYQGGFYFHELTGYNEYDDDVLVSVDVSNFSSQTGNGMLGQLSPGDWVLELRFYSETFCQKTIDDVEFEVEDRSITGIKPIDESPDLNVNINRSNVVIQSLKSGLVTITNLSGQVVETITIEQGTSRSITFNYSAGVYILGIKIEGDANFYSEMFTIAK